MKSFRSCAFTLIELLVVVAIIALLISILLPSLSRAREQGRTVKCITNLKSIGNAAHMYFQDNRDWMPFEKRNYPQNEAPLHGFYYGGHPGRDYDGSEWWGYTNPDYRDTPRGRPFNPYIFDNLPDYDVPVNDPQFEMARSLLSTVFGCPSDTGAIWNSETRDDESPITTVNSCGSSYDVNYHFVQRWATGYGPQSSRRRYLERSNKFLRMQRERNVSRFVLLYEDPFDSSQWNSIGRIGWHRQWMKHSFLFLDGHAANIVADTLNLKNFGTGWKTSAGRWFVRDDDPDYELREIGP